MRLIDADKLRVEVVHSGNIICLPHFSLEQINTAPVVEAIPIKWLCDYAVIIAENNYEQAKFIFRLIENYKSELNKDKDKAAIDNLMRLKENLGKENGNIQDK